MELYIELYIVYVLYKCIHVWMANTASYDHLFPGSKAVESFLEPFSEIFMTCAGAKEVASELRRKRVIPERVENEIKGALDRKAANGLLYDHLYAQGTFQTLEIVCDVFIQEQGYPRMNNLGERMKKELMRRHHLCS